MGPAEMEKSPHLHQCGQIWPAKETHLRMGHQILSKIERFSSLASTTSKGDQIKVSIKRQLKTDPNDRPGTRKALF